MDGRSSLEVDATGLEKGEGELGEWLVRSLIGWCDMLEMVERVVIARDELDVN